MESLLKSTHKYHHLISTLSALTALSAISCDRPPVQRNCEPVPGRTTTSCPNHNDPSARITGTVIYRGPAPSDSPTRPGTAGGRIVLLLFEYNNPPPPQGSATSAVSFQTLSAAQVFANAQRLADGTVSATVPFMFPGITKAGVYQLRAFYSRNEEVIAQLPNGRYSIPSGFHPLFSVRNLPVQGDVGGGAIEDPNAATPRFTRIEVGVRSDANGTTTYTLPEDGYVTPDVSVFIGRPFATDRPMFNVVTTERMVQRAGQPVTLPAPSGLTLTSVPPPSTLPTQDALPRPGAELLQYARDWGLQPAGTEVLNMIRNQVIVETPAGANLPSFIGSFNLPTTNECLIARLAGVSARRDCQSDPLADAGSGFLELAADINENGVIEVGRNAMPPYVDSHPSLLSGSPFFAGNDGHLPWIYPIVLFAKLHEPNATERRLLTEGQNGRLTLEQLARLRVALNRTETLDESDPSDKRYPTIFFGSVVPGGTSGGFLLPWTSGHRQFESTVRVVMVPFAAEIHGPNRQRDWTIIVPPQLPATAMRLGAALSGFANVQCQPFETDIVDEDQRTGIPEGRYSVTFIGPGGQTWSLPNELAEFAAPTLQGNPTTELCPGGVCRAASQAFFVRVKGVELPFVEAICPTRPG